MLTGLRTIMLPPTRNESQVRTPEDLSVGLRGPKGLRMTAFSAILFGRQQRKDRVFCFGRQEKNAPENIYDSSYKRKAEENVIEALFVRMSLLAQKCY